MPIKKIANFFYKIENLVAEGVLYQDPEAITANQKECARRLGTTLQMEQESYLSRHPEVTAMMKMFIANMISTGRRKDFLQAAGEFFTRPAEVLDKEIREYLGLPPVGPYWKDEKPPYVHEDFELLQDLMSITLKHHPTPPWVIPTPVVSTPDTESSSFISIVTSETTEPPPEPILTPEPTISEIFYGMISNNVDKAIFLHVDDMLLRYDTAYVRLMQAVEDAMEVPVIEIREDIAELLYNAYKMFELDIMEKERIAAEIAWEKRMRKKMKRTLRRLNNFRGYETPPTPKSEISSHESYLKPPPKPCVCHPQFHFNRYAKDRFGIYLVRDEEFSSKNVTATPAVSVDSVSIEESPPGKANVKKTTTFDL